MNELAEVKQSQRVTSLSQLYNVFKALRYKETCKNERVTVLRHFYAVPFKLSVKNKTGNRQKVIDKAYKIVNLISRCASIISMDISTAWPKSHIHTWIYPWIYPWISISTASLVINVLTECCPIRSMIKATKSTEHD